MPKRITRDLDKNLYDTIMVAAARGSSFFGSAMNLTLKNIPDEVYRRLKAAAEAHRRSLNSEAIVCLEAVLLPRRVAAGERLAAARALRAALPKGAFRPRDIDGFKRQGRA